MLHYLPFAQPLFKKIHFIGIGGIGMSGIAEILHHMGYAVQGSDNATSYVTDRLQSLGIPVMLGQKEEHVEHATLVVKSTAVRDSNPEIIAAKKRGILIIHRSDMLAALMQNKVAISIAGSHGKTTTTSLMAVTASAGNLDPTVVNGGVIAAYQSNAHLGKGNCIVVEADESDGSFLRLPRTIAVVTNIDREHMDYYGDFAALYQAFHDFITGIPFHGFAVLCADHELTARLASEITTRSIFTYGIDHPADVMASDLEPSVTGTYFTVCYSPRFAALCQAEEHRFFLSTPGRHNVLNALSVITIAARMGLSVESTHQALSQFAGVKRRFTCTGEVEGIRVIDDYAHHPKEIEATLAAARTVADARKGRVLAIFQPHRYTRMQDLMEEFAQCFSHADMLWIADIYSAGEDPIAGISTKALLDKMHAQHASLLPKTGAHFLEDLAHMPEMLHGQAQAGDVVLCMGAGDITKHAYALPHALTALTTKQSVGAAS